MINIEARLICIRHAPDDQEQVYALIDRKPVKGEYYYNRELGEWACIQKALEDSQLENVVPVVMATTNEQYPITRIPKALADAFFTDMSIKTIRLRID